MRKDEDAYPAFGPFLQANSPNGRARVTRPLDMDDLVAPAYLPGYTREEAAPAPHPTPAPARPPASATTTRQLGTGELRSLPNVPRILRPMHIILEPSYMPLAPGRPETIEALLPEGLIHLRPWRGETRQLRVPQAAAQQLHGMGLMALAVPIVPTPFSGLEVVPMTLIMRYEGHAYRWTVDEPDEAEPRLRSVIGALLTLSGRKLDYERE